MRDAAPRRNADTADLPLNIAAEVQLIYLPYLKQGRKQSHLPYKVVRCETASELARDAGGKKQSAEVRAKVKAAERACMDIVMAELRAPAGKKKKEKKKKEQQRAGGGTNRR